MWPALICVAAALGYGPQHMRSAKAEILRHAVEESRQRTLGLLRDAQHPETLASGVLPMVPSGALELVKRELEAPFEDEPSPEVKEILSARSAVDTTKECGLKKTMSEPLAERVDDRYGFVKDFDETLQVQFANTARNFYCLAEAKPLRMDQNPSPEHVKQAKPDPLDFHAKKFPMQFQKQPGTNKQPRCAIVSHSGDFRNLTKTHSLTDEIDQYDLVVRFNQHDIMPGNHGCRTDFRFLNNQFMAQRFRHYYTSPQGMFRNPLNSPQKGFVFLYNDLYNCTKRKEIDEIYQIVSDSTSRPVYSLHPHYEMDLDKMLLKFAHEDPLLSSCVWDGNEHKDMPCFNRLKHRYDIPTKVRGAYKKATLGFYAVWMLLSHCSTLSLYGFASDAFAHGDMKAHQPSLAEQTLWKILANRIERLKDNHGNTAYVYHLMGLQRYREWKGSAEASCDKEYLRQFDQDTSTDARDKFCQGALDADICSRTVKQPNWCGFSDGHTDER